MRALVSIVIFLSLVYTVALFVLSRRRTKPAFDAPDDLFFVFMVPCLNEELVIGKSLERLLSIGGNSAVLVIDDGSDDATAEIVKSYPQDRVWLLQRRLPEARQGKGEALNNAFRLLRDSELLAGRHPHKVIVGVVDADGRLEPNTLHEVAPYFAKPDVGAVQIGVRMYNAHEGRLARLQDMEFVTYTEIFQRARQRLGSVGLGGNGQFARLAALQDLGDAPWTDCLTEDLDLGLRLLSMGWENRFCTTTWVSQQAVTNLKRLIRQRSRWFQGHLQCWQRIPMVLQSRALSTRAAADLVQHLLSPALVLLTSLLLPVTVVTMTALMIATEGGPIGFAMRYPAGMVLWYLLSFGISPIYAFAYWLKEPNVGFLRALFYAHLYSFYSYLWFAAGWWALLRIVRRKRGWAKTARTADSTPAPAPAA